MERCNTSMKRLVLTAALFVGCVAADTADYDVAMAAGTEAFEQGRYAEAEELFLAAVGEAESFGPQDVRLGVSLASLALLYQAQGKHAEAEPLYKRSLTIAEKDLGPEHFNVGVLLAGLAL